MFIGAQIASGVALILIILSRTFKKQEMCLLFNAIANIAFAVSYFMLNAYAGLLITVVCIVRSFVFYVYALKNLPKQLWLLIVFVVLFTTCSIITYTNWIIFILILGKSLSYAYGSWQHNIKVFRWLTIVSSLFTIGYNIFYNGYINILAEIISIIFIIALLIKDSQTSKIVFASDLEQTPNKTK